MAITFITPVEVSPDVADAWTDADLSAHIPSGAVGVVLHFSNPSANTRAAGWRKNGSTDNRLDSLNTNNQMQAYVGVDGSRICEVYQGGTATDIDIYLVGYFEAADAFFFTNAVDKSTGTTSAYEDVDITADLQGADNAIGAFLEVLGGSAPNSFAVRVNGSTDDRAREVTAAHCGFMVGVDTGHIFEQKIGGTTVDVFLIGYLKDTANFTFEDPAVDMSLGVNDAWTDLSALPTGAKGGLLEMFTSTATPQVFGLRKNGSSQDVKPRGRHSTHLIECDASLLIEGYQDVANTDFWRLGYVTTPSAGGAIAGTSAGVATVTGTLTATGTLAGTSAGVATVTGTLVDVVGQTAVPDATISAGDWLNEFASATDLHLSVDEYPTPDDADYIESGLTSSTVRLRLSDILPPEFTP